MRDLVRNPNCRFSHAKAHLYSEFMPKYQFCLRGMMRVVRNLHKDMEDEFNTISRQLQNRIANLTNKGK